MAGWRARLQIRDLLENKPQDEAGFARFELDFMTRIEAFNSSTSYKPVPYNVTYRIKNVRDWGTVERVIDDLHEWGRENVILID